MPSATALRNLLTDTATKLEKFQTKGEAAAFQASVENALLKEELKETKANAAKARETTVQYLNRLQIEQEESMPVIIAVGLGASGLGTLAGMWGHGWAKTNYPESGLAKAATPIVGAVVIGATVMLSEVSPEEKSKGVRPDYTMMAGGLGLGGGIAAGAAYQLYEDYKAANP